MTPALTTAMTVMTTAMSTTTATARLNSTDEMLHGASEKLGSARIIQVLWRLRAPVSADMLKRAWRRLDASPLSRQPVSALVPGARRRWVTAHNGLPPRDHDEPLTDDTLPRWLDEQVRVPLPTDSDSLWHLAAAPYRDGALVSLTVPHFRSDGRGVFAALAGASGSGSRGFLATDLGDALGQTTAALAGSARLVARLATDRTERARLAAALRPAESGSARPASAPRWFSSAIFDLELREWTGVAAAHGGTVNSLFVAIAANLARARVPTTDRAEIHVGIPMSLRESESDDRANAMVVVPLVLPGGEPRHADLGPTRDATRTLLTASGAHSGTLVPEPLWHLLPARYADRLKAPGAQQTDVVASNFGALPDEVTGFFGRQADSVALRTMNVPGLVPERARLRASLCLVRMGERLSVTVTGMPDQFGDTDELRELATEEFTAWGLTPRTWAGDGSR